MKLSKHILSLALALALCLGLALPAMARGSVETFTDEERGVKITLHGFLRKETHRYLVDGEEKELTFHIVEDNSAVTEAALPGRQYASPYLNSDGLTDYELFLGYWGAKSPKVNDFAYRLDEVYTWREKDQAFTTGRSSTATPLYMQPETSVVTPRSSSSYMDIKHGYSILWICESDFAKLVSLDGPSGSSAPAPARGSVETFTDEERGVKITLHGFLRKETHRYLVDGEEKELTFHIVEDNSAVTEVALPGRQYASPYLNSDGLTDYELFLGYWGAKSPKVNDFAYRLDEVYTWREKDQAFTTGRSSTATPLYMQPETSVVKPRWSSVYWTIDHGYSILWICESDFAKLVSLDGPSESSVPTANTAYPSTQSVNVDGKAVEFQCYALKDEKGNATNYIKLRDLALLLGGSAAQFSVGWDGSVTITTKTAYTPNGSELSTPFSGERSYQQNAAATKVNGQAVDLSAFVLNDDNGGGYTYYQLRDLGRALGFNVGWSGDKGIFIETDKPYDPNN